MTLPRMAFPLYRDDLVRWWWQRRKDLVRREAEAQAELETSRELLEESRGVVADLRRMRAENHVTERLEQIIQQRDDRRDRQQGNSQGGA